MPNPKITAPENVPNNVLPKVITFQNLFLTLAKIRIISILSQLQI